MHIHRRLNHPYNSVQMVSIFVGNMGGYAMAAPRYNFPRISSLDRPYHAGGKLEN